jgi:hypothetical protein
MSNQTQTLLYGSVAADVIEDIRVAEDTATRRIKYAGGGEVAAPVNCTAATLTVTAETHSNRVITLNRAAGIAVTLPAATGSGAEFTFVVGTTFTANATIKVASATDYMRGKVYTLSDGAAAVLGYATSNSGTVATESDTITLYTAASNTTGGIVGDTIVLRDTGAAVWSVLGHTQSGGTEATPFSATV